MAQLTKNEVMKLPKEELAENYLSIRETAKLAGRKTKEAASAVAQRLTAFVTSEEQRDRTLLGIDAAGILGSAAVAGHVIGSAEREIASGDEDASIKIGGRLDKDAGMALAFAVGSYFTQDYEAFAPPRDANGVPIDGARAISWGDVLKPMAFGSGAAYVSRKMRERAFNARTDEEDEDDEA